MPLGHPQDSTQSCHRPTRREELVSTDFKSHPGSSIFDLPATMVVDGGRMAKTMAWYDNEYGYSCRLADICALIAERGLE